MIRVLGLAGIALVAAMAAVANQPAVEAREIACPYSVVVVAGGCNDPAPPPPYYPPTSGLGGGTAGKPWIAFSLELF